MSEHWWEKASPGAPMVGPALKRSLYPPDAAAKGKKPSDPGSDVAGIKRAVSRSGHWPWAAFDGEFSNGFAHGKSGNVSENGLAGLQRQNGIDATGWLGEATYNLIRSALVPDGLPHAGEHILDATAIELIEDYSPPNPSSLPALGPMAAGFPSVLDHDLTHATDGIPLYPAFDDIFYEGAMIIAPEPLTVSRQSSSNPGHAFYADGASRLRYWFGHLDRTPSVGRKFAKGELMGLTCEVNIGGGPHVHVAINVEKYPGFGPGDELEHKTGYVHGAPTIRRQLEAVA